MDGLAFRPDRVPGAPALTPERIDEIRTVSRDLEAAFLAEMLRHSGLDRPSEAFGSPGEDAFAGFAADLRAKAMVERGGIGLAEHIFRTIVAQEIRE